MRTTFLKNMLYAFSAAGILSLSSCKDNKETEADTMTETDTIMEAERTEETHGSDHDTIVTETDSLTRNTRENPQVSGGEQVP